MAELTLRCVTLMCLLAVISTAILEPEVGSVRMKRSDDMGSLQTLVEQQASLIQTQQAELTANRNRINNLESSLQSLQDKVEARTKAVAFSARISGSFDSTADGLPLGLHQIVIFDEAITNVGQAYNAKTGIFTAPVAGTYAFFLSLMSPENHDYLYLVITKNGATLDTVYGEGQGDTYDQGSSQVTTHMAAGDQVWVRQEHGEGVRASYWTIFTGYLLQAD